MLVDPANPRHTAALEVNKKADYKAISNALTTGKANGRLDVILKDNMNPLAEDTKSLVAPQDGKPTEVDQKYVLKWYMEVIRIMMAPPHWWTGCLRSRPSRFRLYFVHYQNSRGRWMLTKNVFGAEHVDALWASLPQTSLFLCCFIFSTIGIPT